MFMKNNSDLDIVFEGFNFASGLLAYASLKEGLKVAFKNVENFSMNFEPEITSFYPKSVIQTYDSIKDYAFLRSCSSLFPHLFLPQRLLTIIGNGEINAKFNITVDKLLGLDRETSSLPIVFEKFPVYQLLLNSFKRGTLVFEYRFDRERAQIELLHSCLNLGAKILNINDAPSSIIHIKCAPYAFTDYNFRIKNYTFIQGNNIHISNSYFNLTLQTIFTDTLLTVTFKPANRSLIEIEQNFISLLEELRIPLNCDLENWLLSIYNKQQDNSLLVDPDLNSMRKTISSWEKKISKKSGKLVRFSKAVAEFSAAEMTYDNFRKIQSECDEKFDEAKQTGIAYQQFTYLFYRYRPSIDLMIERAYELLNLEMDADKAWQITEREFFISSNPVKE